MGVGVWVLGSGLGSWSGFEVRVRLSVTARVRIREGQCYRVLALVERNRQQLGGAVQPRHALHQVGHRPDAVAPTRVLSHHLHPVLVQVGRHQRKHLAGFRVRVRAKDRVGV